MQPLTSFAGIEWNPTWSPDGSFVAFSHGGAGDLDIYVMPASDGEPIRLTDSPADETLPRWSPDGRYIAFVSDRGADTNIYLVPPLGGPKRTLVDTQLQRDVSRTELGAVPWSPDGQQLLFSRQQSRGGIAIWKINLATGEETQVTHPLPGSEDLAATWSFDGTRIAFSRSENG